MNLIRVHVCYYHLRDPNSHTETKARQQTTTLPQQRPKIVTTSHSIRILSALATPESHSKRDLAGSKSDLGGILRDSLEQQQLPEEAARQSWHFCSFGAESLSAVSSSGAPPLPPRRADGVGRRNELQFSGNTNTTHVMILLTRILNACRNAGRLIWDDPVFEQKK